MVKKRRVQQVAVPTSIKELPLKYSESVIVPSELVCDNPQSQMYRLSTGETVVFKFGMSCDNRSHVYDELLDDLSKSTYGISYNVLRNGWMYRLGSLSEFWTCMKPVKINYKPSGFNQ